MDELLKCSEPMAFQFPPNSGQYIAFIDARILLKFIKLPEIQREVDEQWVTTLEENIRAESQHNGVPSLDIVDICSLNNELYLINGQHRYYVMKNLIQSGDYDSIPIIAHIKIVNNETELNNKWSISNSSRKVTIMKNTSHQKITNGLRKHLQNNYSCYISSSNFPYRPNINLNSLIEKIEQIDFIKKLNIQSAKRLIELIEEINDYYKSISYKHQKWKDWKIPDFQSISTKARKKSITNTLYLGVYQHFEWLNRIIYHIYNKIEYNDMGHVPLNSKSKSVSVTKRNKVWEDYNNPSKIHERGDSEPSCFVCKKDLLYDNFQCGHIISHFYGGSNSIENLKPICRSCNSLMGIENLYEFRNRLYPIVSVI